MIVSLLRPRGICVAWCIVAAMWPLYIPTARAQDASVAAAVHVASPTGLRAADRASTLFGLRIVSPDGYVAGADGVRLYYRFEGQGPDTVVVLHGGPSLGLAYLAPDLEDLGRELTLLHYDQRGVGRSTVPPGADLAVARHVADLEALRRHFGLDRLVLLGHSWGAMLAAHYAATHPERVARMLFIDPMVPAATPYMAQAGARARLLMEERLDEAQRVRFDSLALSWAEAEDPEAHCRAVFGILMGLYFGDAGGAERTRGNFCEGSAEALRTRPSVDASILGSLGDWDVRPLLSRVDVPVLIVHGGDGAIPLDAMQAWADALPNARLLTVAGAGHYLHVDRPEVFFPVALEFFGDRPQAGANSFVVPVRPGLDASPADLARFAEEVLVEAGDRDWAVALIRDGRVIERRFSRGGDATGHAVVGATTFDLASIAKPVMAWGVMRLVETGRVELDRPIESYLTRWRLPPSAFDHREVTVRRVLSHTAGLTASSSLLPAPDGARPPIEWVLEGRRQEVGIQPGTRYNYSGGYDLLELLIEEVSGQPFVGFMRDEVLRPLGMDRTGFGQVQPDDPPVTRANALSGDVPEENWIVSAAGHLIGNLDELTAFALAHLEDGSGAPRGRGVLQPATLDTMLTPVIDAASGLGYVLRRPSPDLLTAGHAGAGASLFRVAPATGDGLVILTNHADGYAAIARIECVWLAWLAGTERRCTAPASYALMGAYQRAGVQGAFDYYHALLDRGDPDYDVGFALLSEFARMLLAAGRVDEAATAYRMMAADGSDEAAAYGEVADRLVAGFQFPEDRLACYLGEYRSSSGGALRLERTGEGVSFTMIEPVPGITGPLRPLSERVWVMRAGDAYPIELVFDLAPSSVATRVAVRVNDYRIAFSAERTGSVPTCPAVPAEPAGAAADGRAMQESGATGSEVVHVAAPTGEREADRASILAAVEQVTPGGTVQFAPGTYQVGGFIPVTVPGITLLGHSEGTTLRGCEPGEAVDYERAMNRCAGLELKGGHQTVRNLTFESMSWAALRIAGPRSAGQQSAVPISEGGHLIEGNTFRDSDSFDVISDTPEPIVIRNNTFINTYHAVAIQGRNVHFVDNRITAPAHDRIPYGRADIAIGVAQFSESGPPCADNVIAGNRIEGHSDGIVLGVFSPGTSCRGNIVRDNTIVVRPVTLTALESSVLGGDVDTPMVGIPLRLLNYPQWCLTGLPTDAWVCRPDETGRGAVLVDNLIEGNRIIGAAGVAIEMLHAASNRIVNNTISGVARWDRSPEGVLRHAPGWREANGAGIWISAGSDGNEIVANVFDDIAAHTIVLEGDRNRVETLSTSDSVRDLGSSNRVSGPARAPPGTAAAASDHTGAGYESRFVEIGGVRLHYLDFGGEGLPVLFVPSGDRTAYTYVDFAPRFSDRHRVLAITPRGTGESGGERPASFSTRDLATEAGDVLALLDSLGIERAVVLDRWTELPIYLAEQHPDRLAGLVILRGVPPEPDPFDLRARDEAGLLEMYDRAGAAELGRDPDEVAPRREHWYEPRYLRTGERIGVPTLIFMIEPETSRAEIEWEFRLLTDMVANDPAVVSDPVSRAFYERLTSDAALQAQVQSYYETVFAPAWSAAEAAFFRAFDNARIVRLEGENPRSYYQYRDAPDLIYPHIRRFLDELSSSAIEPPSAETPDPGNAVRRGSTASAAPVHAEVVAQDLSHLGPKPGCETPDPLRMPGLDGGDLGRADHGGNGQTNRLIAVGQRDVTGPRPVGGARDHDHPQEGIALAEATPRDDERRSVLASITIGVGKGDANHVPLFKARHSRRDPPRCPIR
jgi:proline iminopeptidase